MHYVQDRADSKRYALKLTNPEKRKKYRSRFTGMDLPREGQILQSIDSPFVVRCYEEGLTTSDQEYCLMEFIDGGTLESLCQQNRIGLPQRLTFAHSMAGAALAVRDAGFVHRSISLDNFVSDYKMTKVVLIDFANAVPNKPEFLLKMGREGNTQFMAPEILRRKSQSAQIDTFSLGISIYWMLTNQHPWGLTENSAAHAIQFDTHDPVPVIERLPNLEPRVANVIDQCLSANPDERPSLQYVARVLSKSNDAVQTRKMKTR
ncbi:MAG: protein kinase [Pirellulaceae bacterium]